MAKKASDDAKKASDEAKKRAQDGQKKAEEAERKKQNEWGSSPFILSILMQMRWKDFQ